MRPFVIRATRAAALLALLVAALPAHAQSQPFKTRLRNGLTVITKEVHTSHVLAINLLIRGGASVEPPELAGLAHFTQQMLLQGSTRRTAEQIAAPLAAVGGTLRAQADYEYSQIYTLSSADVLDDSLQILAEIVRYPRFDAGIIEQQRADWIAEAAQLDDNPDWLIQQALSQSLFTAGPYTRPVLGTPESLKRITRADLVAFHRDYYTPDNLVLVVVGNIERAAVEEKVARLFGDMVPSPRGPAKPAMCVPAVLADQRPVVTVKERDAQIATLAVGFPIAGVSAREYPAVLVLNSLLGGGMGSRLMREVRERQGLGYDLGSFYSQYAGPSYLAAYIKTEPVRLVFGVDGPYPSSEMVIDRAKDAILEQFDWVRQHPVPDAELERARRFTIGTFLYDHQRTLSQARYLGWFELMGLGCHYDDELPRAVEKVTRDDVLAVARKYFNNYVVALVMPEPKR